MVMHLQSVEIDCKKVVSQLFDILSHLKQGILKPLTQTIDWPRGINTRRGKFVSVSLYK